MPSKAKPSDARHSLPAISAPATRALTGAGYRCLKQLAAISEGELLALHGVGPKAIRILREALAAQGMTFASARPSKALTTRKPAAAPTRATGATRRGRSARPR